MLRFCEICGGPGFRRSCLRTPGCDRPQSLSGVCQSNLEPGAGPGPSVWKPVDRRPEEPCAGCGPGAKFSCQFSYLSFSSNCLSASQRRVFLKSPDTRASRNQNLRTMKVSHPKPRDGAPQRHPPSLLLVHGANWQDIFISKITVCCWRENIYKGS